MDFEVNIQVRSQGTVIETAPASAGACLEDALFRGVLEGRLANDGCEPAFELTPEWHDLGPPDARGLFLSQGSAAEQHYPEEVFAPQARHLIRALLAAKRLEPESPVQWRLQLTPRSQGAVASGRVWRNPYPLELDSLPDRPECSLSVAAEDTLLDAVQRRVVAAGATECAGMLLGRVRHDLERRAVLVSLQDEIPLAAGAGGASQVHFSFDPASWVRARLEASRREDGLVPVGWVHSHPPCGACFEQTACPGETVFFSASDEEVHAAAFPSPFMVGLVAGKLRHLPARRPGFRLYGWSRARIVPIPIEVSGPGADAFRAEVRPVTPEED